MDRGNSKRRSREPSDPSKKGKKKKIEAVPAVVVDNFTPDENEISASQMSIFEFPWQSVTVETDSGCDLRDVFFSSLVDGCRAAIGFPGDRLSPPAPIELPDESWPSDQEADGVDCIWSSVLREPLSLRCVQ